MSPERNGFEPEPKPGEQAFENLVAHFERSGHKLNRENLAALISGVRVEDLTSSPLTKQIGEVPLATIHGSELVLDQRFERFSPEQQLHVLAHEYGHTLSWFLAEQPNNERFQNIATLIDRLPNNQISSYVDHLQKHLPEDESKHNFLENEKIAEIFAQYLESDRTFSGFIMAKLLEFPHGDEGVLDSEREQYQKIAEQIGELQGYLEIADSDEEREAFLTHHSQLAPHFQLWQELNTLFEETDFSEIQSEENQLSEHEAWEFMAIAEQAHPEPPRTNPDQEPKTALAASGKIPEEKTGSMLGDLINFWRIFS